MNSAISEMESFFLALGDKTRLRILNLIGDQEVCVYFFTEALQMPQPKISRHLAYLRRVGLVETTRQGKWIYYRLLQPRDEAALRVLDEIQVWMATDEQMRTDRERLSQIRNTPEIATLKVEDKYSLPPVLQEVEEPESRHNRLEDFLL
jgi:ArsR family transcriptional regulator